MTGVKVEQPGRLVDAPHAHTHTHTDLRSPCYTYESKQEKFLSTLSRGVATQERELLMGWCKITRVHHVK